MPVFASEYSQAIPEVESSNFTHSLSPITAAPSGYRFVDGPPRSYRVDSSEEAVRGVLAEEHVPTERGACAAFEAKVSAIGPYEVSASQVFSAMS